MYEFLYTNAFELVTAFLVFLKVIANLTRTEVDNKVFAVIDLAIDYLIPPRKRKAE
jgi:hypothetical protein